MPTPLLRTVFCSIPLAAVLSACGGSTGPHIALPTPVETPPPPLEPEPVLEPAHLGLTLADEEVVTVAVGQTFHVPPDWSEPLEFESLEGGHPGQSATISYDGENERYTLTLPGVGTGTLATEWLNGYEGEVATSTYNNLVDESGTAIAGVSMPTPEAQSGELTYSHWGSWDSYHFNEDNSYERNSGFFAYGMQTPDSGVPITGSATYLAHVYANAPIFSWTVDGTASLTFDFGAGSLAGEMSAQFVSDGWDYYDYDFGTYTFADTVFAAGSPFYSGVFAKDGTVVAGSFFDGSLTGPNAEELIGRFALPFVFGDKDWQLTGIWVGAR